MTVAQQLREEGKLEGKIEGKLEGKIEAINSVAKRLLSVNMDLSFIAQITGLPIEKIKMMKEQAH